MSLRTLMVLPLLALAACGGAPSAKAGAAPAAVPKKADRVAAAAAGAEAAPEYAYSPVGKRDPFRSVIDDQKLSGGDETARPDCGPLCKWELEQLKLVAVISGISNPLAMIEDPGGRGYVVRRGTFVGKRNGRVTQIRAGEVIVSEIYKDQMGKPHVSPVSIKLPVDQPSGQPDDPNLLAPEVAE